MSEIPQRNDEILVFEYSYLSEFVYLLDNSSKQSAHALVNQSLHVVNGLLVRQVQSEFILHLHPV